MYFVLSRSVTCRTVDCTFVRTDAWLDFSRDLVSLWSKTRLKEQMATSQVNVAAEVFQEFLR